jgi:hypothetical protein
LPPATCLSVVNFKPQLQDRAKPIKAVRCQPTCALDEPMHLAGIDRRRLADRIPRPPAAQDDLPQLVGQGRGFSSFLHRSIP